MNLVRNKKNRVLKVFGILLFFIVASFTTYQLTQQEEQHIIGTWNMNDESDNKWIFTSNNLCKWEFEGVITDEFTYSIETTSPQCGQAVPTGDKFSYLKLVDSSSQEELCYEIFGLDQTGMQIRFLGRSKSMFFTKQ